MKKTLSLLLAVLMLFSSIAILTACAKKKDKNGIIYRLNDDKDEYTVVGYKGDDSVVRIPEKFKGVPVTKIGDNAFDGCKSIKKISISDRVTSIGDYAFSLCENLKEIVIPDSVTRIGDYAFSLCYDLEYVKIGDSVESIGASAFSGCDSLESVVLPVSVKKIGRSAFLKGSVNASFSIYYKGTENDWSKINIHNQNSTLKYSPIYYYSLTKPAKGNYWHYVNGVPTIWQ